MLAAGQGTRAVVSSTVSTVKAKMVPTPPAKVPPPAPLGPKQVVGYSVKVPHPSMHAKAPMIPPAVQMTQRTPQQGGYEEQAEMSPLLMALMQMGAMPPTAQV